jgi:hypothetical protein
MKISELKEMMRELMNEARHPSKMSTKAIAKEIKDIESHDYDSTSPDLRARHDALSAEHRSRTYAPSGYATGYEVDKAVARGKARAAKKAATTEEVEIDEVAKWREHPDAHEIDYDGTPMLKKAQGHDPLALRQGGSKTLSSKDPRSLAGRYGSKYAKKYGVDTKRLMANVPLKQKVAKEEAEASDITLDELSQELKTRYKEKAGAQMKELKPFTTKKSEYRDLAKNIIAKRKAGVAKVTEEVEQIDEAVKHDTFDHYHKGAQALVKKLSVALDLHKKNVHKTYKDGYKTRDNLNSYDIENVKSLHRQLQDLHDNYAQTAEFSADRMKNVNPLG